MTRWLKWFLWIIGTVIVLLSVSAVLLSYVIDDRLRAIAENRVNQNLKGYKVRLEDLDLNPFSLSLVLNGLTIVQDKHPVPPVARFTSLQAGLQWRPILSGRIVGRVTIEQPKLYINLKQLREEIKSKTKIKERGWQKALESIYPLLINLLTIDNGELTYIDQDPDRPLRIRHFYLQAADIRNIASREDQYPSAIQASATIFNSGKASLKGQADFLAEPTPAFFGDIQLENISVKYFAPVLERNHIFLKNGRFDTSGHLEYAPGIRAAHLTTFMLIGLQADYVHTEKASPQEREVVRETQAAAEKVGNNPIFQLLIDHLRIQGDVGLVNHASNPNYRLFIADADLRVNNLSNHFSQGPAGVQLNGNFMGSGRMDIAGTFRPEKNGPDFDLRTQIEGTRLRDMNDVFRAYGNFDIQSGTFSLYSELQVRNESINGYVKPFFKDIDVYDRRQDKEKNLFRKMYEGLVGGIAGLLSRNPQEQVAARTDMSGPVENPRADTWQIFLTVIQNAFFKSILPGFDQAIEK